MKYILWQGLNWPGSEYCCLAEVETGWTLSGTALLAHEGQPVRAMYQIECDLAWRTRQVIIEVEMGPSKQRLHLAVDEEQRWRLDGRELPELAGCLDVDLGFSPSTNTLPIRRLDLSIGSSAEVTAVWVRFPSFKIELLPQRYTRLAESRYRYESKGGAFVAELEVDEVGLVVHYPGGWQQIN
jgi:hypothetical protein